MPLEKTIILCMTCTSKHEYTEKNECIEYTNILYDTQVYYTIHECIIQYTSLLCNTWVYTIKF